MDILLLAFNRLDIAKLCIDKIYSLRLADRIYLSIDGGRTDKETQIGNSIEEYALDRLGYRLVDVQRLSDNNGCRRGVEKGISWFFNNVDCGVICEDDILIENDFLEFCQYVKNNDVFNQEDVCHISAYRPQLLPDNDFPVKSRTAFVWGWFTTREMWGRHIELMEAHDVNNFYEKVDYFSISKFNKKRVKDIKRVLDGKVDTWDWFWHLSMRYFDNYSIVPTSTLSRNIGSSSGAHASNRFMLIDDVVVNPCKQKNDFENGKLFDEFFLKKYYSSRFKTVCNEIEYRVKKCFQI